MKKFSFGFLSLIIAVITALPLSAKEPEGYYKNAEGKNKAALLSALCEIVGPHTEIGYRGLWSLYKESDVRADGTIWDMYSTSKYRPGSDQCGSYTAMGDCYNREHSFPKSWFNDEHPMFSDAYHIYPTDGKVNSQRSNYAFGECEGGKVLSPSQGVKSLGRLGTSTFPGFSGTVFEPDDEYKGDFARSYFYMAATYNDRIAGWSRNSGMLSGDSYPCYTQWAINLLLKWSRQDPVSQKELDRNEVVAKWQDNRNPFIDHPELAEYIWGNMKEQGWVPGGKIVPMLTSPSNGDIIDLGVTTIDRTITKEIVVKGSNLKENVTVSCNNSNFSLSSTTLAKDAVISANGATLTVSFAKQTPGSYSATLTLSSSEIENTTVTLNAKSVDGIPANPAENITTQGFVASWVNVSGTGVQYTLNLYKDGTKEQSIAVDAALESYQFTGLQHSTKYSYDLTYGSLKSNTVEVTTATPVPVLSLTYGKGDLDFKAVPGEASEAVEVKVYTENVTDEITATVDGSFEISFDKTKWNNSLIIDNAGESFFVRSKAIESEGSYKGSLKVSTPTVSGSTADLSVTVAAPRPFLEDWETGKTGGYWDNVVEGNACSWKFQNAGLWKDTDRHGNASCRFGKDPIASIEMNEDKPNGAGTFSFYASVYGSDSNSVIAVEYSTDKAKKWDLLEEITISETTLTQYSIKVEKTGDIRFRIIRTNGKRINIDDIEISDFTPSGIESATDNNWDILPAANGVNVTAEEGTKVIIYSLNAVPVYEGTISVKPTFIPLEKGMYIVTLDDQRAKKIIVK